MMAPAVSYLDRGTEPVYPVDQLGDPVAPWIFDNVMPIVWGVVFVLICVQTWRRKTFGLPSLLFLASTTMFWIEWPADWGSYLVYNKDFRLFEVWTSTWYQTYWKPVGVVFGYGLFFGLSGLILVKVIPAIKTWAKTRLPNVNQTMVVVLSSAVIFYAFDLGAERVMTVLGWYSYVTPVGIGWTSSRGSMSLVWPALPFLLDAIALSLLVDRRNELGFFPNERWFRVDRLGAGWPREFARLGVWILTLNVLIFVTQPVILVLGRILFLHDSEFVP